MGDGDDPVDRFLENLLEMDGDVYVINDAGDWVKFAVSRVPRSPERPQGIQYSLTLHDASNRRVLGFDNAHSAPASHGLGRRERRFDHRHLGNRVRPYSYQDGEKLLRDFWAAVDSFLAEKRGKK